MFASHMELSRESKVTDQVVKKMIDRNNNNDDDDHHHCFFTEYQRKKFDEVGLDHFISLMRAKVIQYCLKRNGEKTNKTIKELNISSASFYRWKDGP